MIETETPVVHSEEEVAEMMESIAPEKKKNKLTTVLLRAGAVLLTTVLLLVVAIYGAGFILVKGPSQQMSNLFVMTMRETSAMKWVANLYLSAEEIDAMETAGEEDAIAEMDADLVQIGAGADAYGLVDEVIKRR